MSKPRYSLISVSLLSACVMMISSGAQAQPELQNGLARCAVIGDVLQRLACFDQLAAPYLPASEPAAEAPARPAAARPVTAVPAAPVAAPAAELPTAAQAAEKQQQVENFGKSSQAEIERNAAGEQELVDTVTSVRQVEPTKLQVTLSSGQVWRQTIGKRFRIREGDTVRISPSSWGDSFRLSVEGRKGFIQVGRVDR